MIDSCVTGMMRGFYIQDYGPVDSHAIRTVPVPQPAEDEVQVRVHAIGLNFPDLLMFEGKYQVRHETPFVPGRDAAGVVTAVGQKASMFRPGDRVVCQVAKGAFAEVLTAPIQRCFHLPDSIDFHTAAAMITPFNTAYVAVVLRAGVGPSDTVLVTGANGAIGLAMIQLAKQRGAKVIACVSSTEKVDIVKRNGADEVIIVSGDNLKESLPAQVLPLTNGNGVEIVLETVGGTVFDGALRSLAFAGKLVIVGLASLKIPEIKPHLLLYRNWGVIGAPLDIHFTFRQEQMRAGISELHTLITKGLLKPNITKVVPFERFHDAISAVQDRSNPGRIVVSVG